MRAKHISATGNGSIGGSGSFPLLGMVNVNTAAASAVLTIYEGTTTSGPVVAVIDASVARSMVFFVECKDGIHWVLAGGNADITISYK